MEVVELPDGRKIKRHTTEELLYSNGFMWC